MPFLCRAFGLLLRTELPIPGALPIEDLAPIDRPADLCVTYGSTGLTDQQERSGPYRVGREGLLFEKAGVARFLCAWDGSSIRVEAAAAVAQQIVAEYLIATALPAALWLRGEMMLHAGAAVLPGGHGAVALLGASGAGKSTLLRHLLDAGASIVAEDSLCLRVCLDAPEVSGLPGCLHLRAHGAPLHAERATVIVPQEQRRSAAPLRKIVLLEPEDAVRTGWTRLAATEALAALLRHRHRPRVPELAGLSARLLPRWGDIARSIPVYSLKFARPMLAAAKVDLVSEIAAIARDAEERL